MAHILAVCALQKNSEALLPTLTHIHSWDWSQLGMTRIKIGSLLEFVLSVTRGIFQCQAFISRFRNPLCSLFYLRRHFKVRHRTGRFFPNRWIFRDTKLRQKGTVWFWTANRCLLINIFTITQTQNLEKRSSCVRLPLTVIYGPDPAYWS